MLVLPEFIVIMVSVIGMYVTWPSLVKCFFCTKGLVMHPNCSKPFWI